MKTEVANLENELNQFTGTEGYHKFSPLSKLVMTDGVKYLCDKAGFYWFLDIIASYQPECMEDEMLKGMQFWTLRKAGCYTDLDPKHPLYKKIKALKGNEAIVYCERDTNNVFLYQDIPYTDFPLDTIKLYCNKGELRGDEIHVILLPSEY